MRRIVAGALLACLVSGASLAGDAAGSVVEQGVRQAATNYIESYLQGDPAGMEASIHPAIVRRGVVRSKKAGESFLMNANAETILNDAREGRIKLPEGEASVAVDVLDVSEDVASARVSSSVSHDNLTLVRSGDTWRVAATLWTPPAKSQLSAEESDLAEVKRTVEEMIRACLSHDTERLHQLVHPAVSRRMVRPAEGEAICALTDLNAQEFLEASARSGGGTVTPEVTVLEVYRDIAAVRVTFADAVDYLQLMRQGTRWMVVNCVASVRAGSPLHAAR